MILQRKTVLNFEVFICSTQMFLENEFLPYRLVLVIKVLLRHRIILATRVIKLSLMFAEHRVMCRAVQEGLLPAVVYFTRLLLFFGVQARNELINYGSESKVRPLHK